MSQQTCARCGRIMTPRKNWKRQSTPVRYCSKQCRRLRIRRIDRELEAVTIALLTKRPKSSSICPSEVAKHVRPESWNEIMESARMAARRLMAQGQVEITQGGRVVDPSTAKGPIRIRRSSAFGAPSVAR